MKADANMPIRALPTEEWDFYNTIDEQEAQFAFFYEYGRDSISVKAEVEKMRAARPREDIWPYCPRQHHLYEVIYWLAQQNSFPQTPWLSWKKETFRQIQQRRAETKELEKKINAGRHEFIKLPPGLKVSLPTKSPEDPVETIEWICTAWRDSKVALRPHIGFESVWLGDTKAVRAWHARRASTFVFPDECEIKPQPEASVLDFTIDWRLTDREITDMVSQLIKSARPRQFKEYAKTPRFQRGVDTMLPFRTTNALQWLGVLRCYNSVKGWREFFKRYNPNVLGQTGRGSVKSRDISELARPRIEDCRKAKLILDWFNNGEPLRKESFE